jgi:lipopolysaccharide transport protein LptA
MYIDLLRLRGLLRRLVYQILKGYMRTGLSIRGRLVLFLLAFLPGIQAVLAGPLDFSSDDTVTITAERGWEGDEADVIHFSGKFELHAPDWSMAGDTAVVYGDLDNPDRVVLEGNPAKISFLRSADEEPDNSDKEEKIDGTAKFVEYFRATDKLIMRGAASLIRKDSTLASEIIEYNVDTDRYSASGEGGINIQFNPDDD